MKLKFFFAFVLVALLAVFASSAGAAAKYVKADATGDGSSWANASGDLRSILSVAASGDIIYVASGDYNPGGSTNDSFTLQRGVKLYGGFNPANTGVDSGDRDIKKYVTILDGGNVSRSVALITCNESGATPDNTRIDGFTITGGTRTSGSGGGMYSYNTASPTVTNCTFLGNMADSGGGMYNYNSSPVVTNCTFSENTATGGTGGGMYNRNSSPTVMNCTFSRNMANNSGGGMYNYTSLPAVTNCTFYGNTATNGGGVMFNITNSSPMVVNSILWGNSPNDSQIVQNDGTLTLSNNVISAGGISVVSGTINSSDIITGNPNLGTLTNGYYPLSADSPAIDKGLSVGTHNIGGKSVTVPAIDQLGTTRPQGDGVDIGSFEYIPAIPVTGVTLNKSTMSLTVGGTETLTATVAPADATNDTLTWSSNNESIATVSANGLVTAVATGNAMITVTTADGGFTATCAVTVTDPVIPVTGVTLNKSTMSLTVGDTEPLTATIAPTNATNNALTWSSNAPSIAMVSDWGLVTAVAAGSATITVTTVDGNFAATCTVTVTDPIVSVTGVTLNKSSMSLTVGDTETLTATVAPADATNQNVTWSSSNPGVATVIGGVVTALAAGSATITVTTADGNFTATCVVTVTDPVVPVTGVTLNKSTISLTVGGTETLIATVIPANATNKDVTWSSSEPNVATVDTNGLVTGVAAGNAMITVTTADGGFAATCAVTVTEPIVPVTGVTLNKSTMSLTVGDTETLTATVAPANATNNAVTWSSSEPNVATVDANGLVTAIAAGTATITVTTADSNFTATCAVTVTSPVVSVTGVTLDKSATSLTVGSTETLTATIVPTNATSKDITWTSSSPSVATVSSTGLVTAIAAGSATITVTTVDGGFTAMCAVTVTDPIVPVTDVTLNKSTMSLTVGSTETLTATVAPADATSKDITWTSSSPSVATVDANGLVTAVAAGNATITVTTTDGGFIATCAVTVTEPIVPVTGVTIDKTTTSLTVGGTETLTATVIPANATNKDVTWSSSKPNVATVDANGLVTAISAGTATITATTADGGFTATCAVTVTEPVVSVTGVTLNKSTMSLTVGGTEQLTATIVPANATTNALTWSSNAPSIAMVSDSGLVTAIAAGSATITVTTVDGNFAATCAITVTEPVVPVTGVTLNKSTTSLTVGDTETLTATIAPTDATNDTLTWSSNNEGIATVDANGLVTAIAAGTATITVTTVDGGFTATCAVIVIEPVVHVTGVTLNKTATSLTVGGAETLTATVAPTNATNQNITWSSSNPGVATVIGGVVTAVVAGSATITVTTVDGGFIAMCAVTVTDPIVPVTGVTLNKSTISLTVGDTETLTATIAPANATNNALTWSSNAPSIATVSTSGLVTAIAAGTATITVTTADGNFVATCAVIVIEPIVPVTGVTLNKTATSLTVGDTETLIATIAPTNATNQNVTWSSSNPGVATVIGGVVTAVVAGSATITVTTVDGNFATTCTVTVTDPIVPVTGVTLNKSTMSLTVGDTETLTATVAPTNATSKDITWTSISPSVATVDASGLVTAIAAGTATITVTTADSNFTATCAVTVTSPVVSVTGIALNKSTISLTVGGTEILTATVAPTNATNQNVTWASSEPNVATVDANGLVTAIAAGTATITVTTADGNFVATCAVIVTEPIVPATGVTLNKSTISLTVGGTETLTATIAPTDATNDTLTWSSNNEGIATVDANGLVTAISAGTATITATTADGGFTATCAVTITEPIVPVTGVSIDKTTTSLTVGGTETLTATVIPANATNKDVTWSSSKPNVATVDANGLVTAVAAGTATITVTTADSGFTATCAVTVVVPITGVTLNKSTISLTVGGTETLSATIAPADATSKDITWTSDNENIATVNASGLVTAIAAGSATITVTTTDGGFTATCAVTVTDPVVHVTGVTLNKSTTSLTVGGAETLTATVAPTNATNQNVTWASSEPNVATVDANGLVTAIAAGNATITVTTVDGNFTATCTVTVTAPIVPVTGVTLNKSTMSLTVGGTETLIATIAPMNATNNALTWSSNAPSIATAHVSGLVLAIAAGNATITVMTTDGGFTATCAITITEPIVPVTGVTLNKSTTSLTVGDTETLIATVAPADATSKDITWSSSSPSVATVDANGLVTAVATGSATITVTTADGGFTATCAVIVIEPIVPVTGVTLNKTATSLTVGGTETLTATVAPTNATSKDVTWTSDNESVATVNASGVVTAIAAGSAMIIVTTSDGNFTVTCAVTVTDPVVPVTGVTLNKSTMSLTVGDTETLTATVTPANATNDVVTWSSNAPSIATVSSNGLVTGIAAGNATITVTTTDGNFTATCAVTVTEPIVPVTGVTIDKTTISLTVGNTATLTATITPTDATNDALTWSSNNEGIVTVSDSGVITAVAAGSATITVTTSDGGFTATCAVTVTIPVTGVSIDKTIMSLTVGSTETLTATVAPADATNKDITWTSSEPNVATVDANGLVTAIAAGNATITVTTADGGFIAMCAVTVTDPIVPVTGVSIDKTTTSLTVGGTETLTATIAPADATSKDITWTSSKPNVATVDANGLVTAVAAGTATITVTTADGGFTATCAVTMTDPIVPVTGVTLNKSTTSLTVGDTETLTATVAPANATSKDITWTSSSPSVATVDASGLVAAIAAGSATITATTVDGGFTATCTVTVTDPVVPVTGVTLNKSTTSLTVGGAETLTATIAPANATNQSMTWSSSNESIATVSNSGLVTAIAVGSATITVTTADGGFTATCAVTMTDPIVPVTGVSIDKKTMSLMVGSTGVLSAEVLPANATGKDITWTSSEPDVATVSSVGLVTANSDGNATITASSDADPSKAATCTVTVTAPAHPPEPIPVTGVTLSPTTAAMIIGTTQQLIATVAPANATSKDVTWSSGNESAATVSATGLVTAVATGEAAITATTVDGGRAAACAVTVVWRKEYKKPELPGGTPENVEPSKLEGETDIEAVLEQMDGKFKKGELTTNQDGEVVVRYEVVKAAAEGVIDGKKEDVRHAVILPVFTAQVQKTGNVAAVEFTLSGSAFFATKTEDVRLLKILSSSTGELFKFVRVPAEAGDGTFAVQKAGETDFHAGAIDADAQYKLLVFIKDGGKFDLDDRENGKVMDPLALLKIEPISPDGGGGGCSAGFFPLILLFAIPLFLKK